MLQATDELSRKAVALAARLRIVQAQLADEKPEVRQEELDRVIEGALSAIPPQDREQFFGKVLDEFPSFGASNAPSADANGKAGGKGTELPKDPAAMAEVVADGLAKAWGSLNESQRKGVLEKLTKAGVVPPASSGGGGGGGALPESVTRDLRGKLQLGTSDTPDAARVAELSAMLADFVLGADKLVWGMWSRKISPMSSIRSNGPLQRTLRDFVTAKIDPTQSQSGGGATDVRRLLEMTVALVSAIGQAGTGFAEKFLAQYHPSAVEEVVGDSAFRNKDAECWKVYKARAGALDRTAIDVEITQSIAKFVEDWMKKSGR